MYDGLKRTYLLHIPGPIDVNNKKGKWFIGRTSRDIDACEVIWDFFEKHPGEK